MGVGAADEGGVGGAGKHHVVDIVAGAGEETRVLAAAHGLAEIHCSAPLPAPAGVRQFITHRKPTDL